jgi:hypothetical protein
MKKGRELADPVPSLTPIDGIALRDDCWEAVKSGTEEDRSVDG